MGTYRREKKNNACPWIVQRKLQETLADFFVYRRTRADQPALKEARSPRLWSLISRNGAYLGPMLLLNISRKAYMGSPKALSHLSFSDLKRSLIGNLIWGVQWHYQIWPWVTLKSQKSRSLRFCGSRSVWYTYICLRLISTSICMSQTRTCWRWGFPLSQWSFMFCYCNLEAHWRHNIPAVKAFDTLLIL